MPRSARASKGGICYHVLNRGNRAETTFHDAADYRAFIASIRQTVARTPMRLLSWCLMWNHFHMVLWPHRDGDLGRWMHRLMTVHVGRHRKRHQTIGHIWQGRFKAFPIQRDDHLLAVMRYVERNPLRARLVERAEQWPWSSLGARVGKGSDLLTPSPVPLPDSWVDWVNTPQTAAELADIRERAQRGRPFGDPAWSRGTAERLGLRYSLRKRGRPKAEGRVVRHDLKELEPK